MTGPGSRLVAWSVVVPAGCEVGERPVLDELTGVVHWVDVLGGALHALAQDGTDRAVVLGSVLGAVGLRDGGGLVAAVDDAVVQVDVAGRPLADPVPVPVPDGVRFNDGVVDPAGGFVVGTASLDGAPGRGALYRVTADGRVDVLLEGVTESNGLAWSADGRTLWYVDSGEPVIRCYDWDPDAGRLGARRPDLVVAADGEGCPDGLVTDAAGTVWAAMWEGSAVRRWSPDGEPLAVLPTPVSRPTCPGFGPTGLLLTTSGWQGMSDGERAAEPWAGHVLATEVSALPGARGVRAARFGAARFGAGAS